MKKWARDSHREPITTQTQNAIQKLNRYMQSLLNAVFAQLLLPLPGTLQYFVSRCVGLPT